MADMIKKFFQKKKSDAKFKLAGPGHKLTESTSSIERPRPKKEYKEKPRTDLSDEARRAAAAALARIESKQQDKHFNTSFAAIQAQVKRELEAERKAKLAPTTASTSVKLESQQPEVDLSILAVSDVYFKCGIVGPDVLTKDEWKMKIKQFLYEQLEFERGLTSVLMIYSLNKNRDKINECVKTLIKYLENIVNNPTEEKYQRIRMSNRVFKEKVVPIEGSLELLQAAGFQQETLTIDQNEEEYLVFDINRIDNIEILRTLCDALENGEPIPLELDRNLQVLSPSQASKRSELPPSFFSISPEEIKREQQAKAELMEKTLQLRTKAMREKDELREMKKYRYALIRIRFPDGIFLQGTFSVFEKLVHIFEFVRDNLEYEDIPFILAAPTGERLNENNEDMDKSLIELHLVPATILTFEWDPDVLAELSSSGNVTYLKPEVQMLVRSI